MARRPNLFLAGAPKSGTTSLYSYLEGHPDVYMSPVKEPFYFSPDVLGSRQRQFHYPEDEARYLELYDEAADQKWVGEASTNYLVSRQAPGLVHDFSPDARVVAMLRNPVDLVYSLHNERVSNGAEPIVNFDEAMAAEADRHEGRRLPPKFNTLGGVYIDHAMLGEQLQRWMSIFPRDHIHTIVFGDLERDTPAEFRRLLEFLEVDPTYRPAEFDVKNPSNRRRGGVVRSVVDSRPAKTMRRRVLPAVIGERATYRLAKGFSRSRLNRRRYERPPLSRATRLELQQRFTDDVRLLGELLGRDFEAEWFGGPNA